MEKYERLQALLGVLRKKFSNGKTAALARRIGKDESYVGRLFYPSEKPGSKGIGPEITDACNQAFKLPRGFWDMDVDEARRALEMTDSPAAGPASAPPPLPPRDFNDRQAVSESDWGVLQDVRLVMSEDQLKELRNQAERIRRIAREQMANVSGADSEKR